MQQVLITIVSLSIYLRRRELLIDMVMWRALARPYYFAHTCACRKFSIILQEFQCRQLLVQPSGISFQQQDWSHQTLVQFGIILKANIINDSCSFTRARRCKSNHVSKPYRPFITFAPFLLTTYMKEIFSRILENFALKFQLS